MNNNNMEMERNFLTFYLLQNQLLRWNTCWELPYLGPQGQKGRCVAPMLLVWLRTQETLADTLNWSKSKQDWSQGTGIETQLRGGHWRLILHHDHLDIFIWSTHTCAIFMSHFKMDWWYPTRLVIVMGTCSCDWRSFWSCPVVCHDA